MTLRIPAKVLLHVWSYDFYDMTLSTGKQRRHMIKRNMPGNISTSVQSFMLLSKSARSLKISVTYPPCYKVFVLLAPYVCYHIFS